MQTREEMIEAIYKEIADKTLSFGCKIKTKYWIEIIDKELTIQSNWHKNILYSSTWPWFVDYLDECIIIWHDVMIWDVLEYALSQHNVEMSFTWKEEVLKIVFEWDFLRLPIEKQSDETIKFVFDLLPKN